MHLTRPDGASPRDFTATRRSLGALLFAGAAFGALPALAQANPPIRTPADGLITGMVRIPQQDRPLPAYVARPDARGNFATIIVVSEVFGLHDYIKDVCRRLAQLGYVAIAPDYFHRAGNPAAPSVSAAEMARIATAATNEQVMDDTGATIRWLGDQPFANRDIGITGFSWGGAAVWMACARFPELGAGVAWYGRLMKPPSGFLSEEARLWPIDAAPRLRSRVLGLYAGDDQGIAQDEVDTMREVLRRARRADSPIIVYPGVQHGFHADYRPSYDAEASADAWGRMLEHFARHGVRPRRWRR